MTKSAKIGSKKDQNTPKKISPAAGKIGCETRGGFICKGGGYLLEIGLISHVTVVQHAAELYQWFLS